MSAALSLEFTATQYIEDVLAGRVVVCELVRLAVERHVADLEDGAERGLYFDEQAARLAISFFSLLRHSKGEWAGTVIKLEPWQQFALWVLFGWKRSVDGFRRFRTSYWEVARKNGKSTVAAGVGLFGLLADGEAGAEIYTAATKRDQARICHGEATRMVKGSAALRREVRTFKDNLHVEATASKYEPLGADVDGMDGLNTHFGIIDELHAHKTRALWDVIETSQASRRQPLMFGITTAGFDRASLCWELREYTVKVLKGIIQDDTWFGLVFTLDKGDDWEDERNWIKANPNLGVSKKLDDMRRLAKKAAEMPSALNAFLRLNLNVWTQAETKWLSWEHWEKCGGAVAVAGLQGRTCYAGLDLSSNTDLTAFVLVFPPANPDDNYQVLAWFWVPDEAIEERTKKDRVPYEAWVRQGFITATAGNVVDYAFILSQIEDAAGLFDIDKIAFDRWGAAKVSQDLQEMSGDEDWVVDFGQGFASMSPPMKELETLILGHKINHGNNPVLTWNADNLVARVDPAGNIKPDKSRSREKIDGMVALIMALDLATRNKPSGPSVYESRGVRTIGGGTND